MSTKYPRLQLLTDVANITSVNKLNNTDRVLLETLYFRLRPLFFQQQRR